MARSAPAPAGHRGAPGLGAAGSALLPPEFLPRNFVPGGRRERAPGAGRARPRPRPRCRARGARGAPPNAAPAAPGAPGTAPRAPRTAPGGAHRGQRSAASAPAGAASGVPGPAPRPPRLPPRAHACGRLRVATGSGSARCPLHRLLCSSAEIALRQLLHSLAPLTPLWVPQNASCVLRLPSVPSPQLLSNSFGSPPTSTPKRSHRNLLLLCAEGSETPSPVPLQMGSRVCRFHHWSLRDGLQPMSRGWWQLLRWWSRSEGLSQCIAFAAWGPRAEVGCTSRCMGSSVLEQAVAKSLPWQLSAIISSRLHNPTLPTSSS